MKIRGAHIVVFTSALSYSVIKNFTVAAMMALIIVILLTLAVIYIAGDVIKRLRAWR